MPDLAKVFKDSASVNRVCDYFGIWPAKTSLRTGEPNPIDLKSSHVNVAG